MRRLGAVPPRRATVTSSRLSVTCGTGIITGLAVYAPAWTDETTPRTERPVRFMVVRSHPVFRAFSDAFRSNLPATRVG